MAITVPIDSYTTVAAANTYLTGLGLDSLDANLDEQLLRRATKTLDRRYGRRWLGTKTLSTQPLLWPRFTNDQMSFYQYNAYGDLVSWTSQTIPTELAEATAELALQLQNAETTGFDEYSQGNPSLKSKSESVGDLSVSEEYTQSYTDRSDWNKIDLILGPLIDPGKGGATITTARAA